MKTFFEFLSEKKKHLQEYCESCGTEITDPNKECKKCGFFNKDSYHESAQKQTYNSDYVKNSNVFQKNQTLTE